MPGLTLDPIAVKPPVVTGATPYQTSALIRFSEQGKAFSPALPPGAFAINGMAFELWVHTGEEIEKTIPLTLTTNMVAPPKPANSFELMIPLELEGRDLSWTPPAAPTALPEKAGWDVYGGLTTVPMIAAGKIAFTLGPKAGWNFSDCFLKWSASGYRYAS